MSIKKLSYSLEIFIRFSKSWCNPGRKQIKSNINIVCLYLWSSYQHEQHHVNIHCKKIDWRNFLRMSDHKSLENNFLLVIYKNISHQIQEIGTKTVEANLYYNDNKAVFQKSYFQCKLMKCIINLLNCFWNYEFRMHGSIFFLSC